MPKTMKERYEQAKRHQKNIANSRLNRKNKNPLSANVIVVEKKRILGKQLGLCGICCNNIRENQKFIHLDHDHATGELRGVLCHNCNVGLGHFKDNVDLLVAAIDYLNKFRKKDDRLIVKLEVPDVIKFDNCEDENWWSKLPDNYEIKMIWVNSVCHYVRCHSTNKLA